MIIRVKLVKRITDDGVDFVRDEVPLGTLYEFNSDTLVNRDWRNLIANVVVTRPSAVVVRVDNGSKGWMPIELFEVDSEQTS